MLSLNIFLTVFSPYTTVVVLLIVGIRVLHKDDILYKNPWNTGLLLLFAWSLLVGIINKEPFSASASVGLLMYFLFSVYLQNYYCSEEKIEILLKKLVFFSIGSAFIAIAEKVTSIFYDTIWWGNIFGIPTAIASRDSYRVYSTFGNPNVAGAWFAAMILVCLYFYNRSKGYRKFAFGIITCLFASILFLTGSRGAAIGLILGIASFGIFNKEKRNLWFIALIFAFISISMFIYPQLAPQAHTISTSVIHDVSDSASSRELIWLSSLNMFKLKPLTGWGLLGVYFVDPSIYLFHTREFHSHNIWITLIATLGVVGLGIYAYMKYNLYKELKMLWNSGCKFVPLLLSIQILVLGHGMVDFTIMTPQGGFIFFGCSSIIYALAIQYGSFTSRDYYSLHTLFSRGKSRSSYDSTQKI